MPGSPNLLRIANLAATAALVAAGWNASVGPAHALPPAPLDEGNCQQWGFPGQVIIKQATGETVSFNSTGPIASGPAPWKHPNGPTEDGSIAGNIIPDGSIFLTWIESSTNRTVTFVGSVDAFGGAHGNRDGQVAWNTLGPMTCTQQAQAPTDAVTLTFNPANLNVNGVFVNSSTVAGQCHYQADPVGLTVGLGKTDDFALGSKATVTRSYPAPLPGSTYHVVVSCRGSFNGQQVEFGHIDQNFSF